MPDALAARAVAFTVLRRVERDHAYADVALDAALAHAGLDARDRALAARLVYGTLAWQGFLDWHLRHLAGRDPAALDLAVRLILRLGSYQILRLDRIPAHAAVGTSVELAKRIAPAAAGLVNAVLRRAARERESLDLPDPESDPVRHLAVAYSHPDWLVARWRERFGAEELRRLLAADNDAAPTVLRAHAGDRERLLADLALAGIDAAPGRYAPDAVRVDGAAPHALPGYAGGALSVQSEASQLVVRLLDPPRDGRVLDVCAAPGGKAAYAADLVGDGGLVVALDRRRRGAAAIAAGARRLGLTRLAAGVGDARLLPLAPEQRFDRVLVDAPCSGLGTLRGHPEVRWSRGPADVERLARLQAAILEAASDRIRPGGVLVYATCTISTEENEGVVEPWLAAHPELERENAAAHLPLPAATLVDAEGALRTLPHRDDLDGFYAVRVRRTR